MAERFKYEKRYYYPHMKPADIAIWERFVEKNPDYFDECEYDVAVGSGPGFDTTVNAESGGEISKLYQRKIDVIGWKAGQQTIVEVKPAAGTSALGQLLGYVALYDRDYLPAAASKAMLLTDRVLPDMAELANKYKIKLITA